MKLFFENHPLVQQYNDEIAIIKAKNHLNAVFEERAKSLTDQLNGMPLQAWEFAQRAAAYGFSLEWIEKKITSVKSFEKHKREEALNIAMFELQIVKSIEAAATAMDVMKGQILATAKQIDRWNMSAGAFQGIRLLRKYRKRPVQRIKKRKQIK